MPRYVCQRCYWAGYNPAEFSRLNDDDVICTPCWIKSPAVKQPTTPTRSTDDASTGTSSQGDVGHGGDSTGDQS